MSGVRRRRGQDRLPSSGIKHEGSLTKFGYNLEESEATRHEALDQAVENYGYAETIRKLAALEGVNKGHPNHAKVASDIEHLQKAHAQSGGKKYQVIGWYRPNEPHILGGADTKAEAQEIVKRREEEDVKAQSYMGAYKIPRTHYRISATGLSAK